MSQQRFFEIKSLGEQSDTERAAFYDELVEDDASSFNLFGRGQDANYFENPTLRVGLLLADGRVVPASQASQPAIKDTRIDVWVERYFVQAMPANDFALQLVVAARHLFKDRKDAQEIAFTLAARGVLEDYVNCLSEPAFRGLTIKDSLSLGLMVNFVGDRTTDALLSFMDSEAVKKGMQLANTYNPVFGTVTTYCRSIVAGILKAKKNKAITNMNLSFLSEPGEMSTPLVEGTYLLIQPLRDEKELSFADISFDATTGKFVTNGQPLKRNHLVIRVKIAAP
jgi:hypothetical protein